MITATTVNASLIRQAKGSPSAMLAALGILAASLYVAHSGLVGVFKAGELAGVMTLLLVCLSYLQWKTMGRARATRLVEGPNAARAWMQVAQAAFLFVLESTLNTIGVVILAAKGGQDWGSGLALLFAIALAAGIAWLNLTVKFVSSEPLASAGADDVAIESEPPPGAREPARHVDSGNVVPFALRDRTLDEIRGLQAIYQMDIERPRQAEIEAIAARKDELGRWKKAEAPKAAPRRRRKAAA